MQTAQTIQYDVLVDLLTNMNERGGFEATILTDENGLPFAASYGAGDNSEAQSAVVAQVQKVVMQVRDHLSMAEPEEIALNDVNGKKLICRPFNAGVNDFILAAVIPEKNRPYRKVMNRVVRTIQKTWSY